MDEIDSRRRILTETSGKVRIDGQETQPDKSRYPRRSPVFNPAFLGLDYNGRNRARPDGKTV